MAALEPEQRGNALISKTKAGSNMQAEAYKDNVIIHEAGYYRIQSPVILIEFDQQQAVSLPGHPETPLTSNVHSVVRTPNVNDYDQNLLQQHLAEDH